MGCTTRITTSACFYNRWKMCRGVYWSLNGGQENQYADVVMSRTGGNCPSSGVTKRFYLNHPETLDEFTVNVFHAYRKEADIEVWKTSELNDEEEEEEAGTPENEFGFGKAEITQTNIGPGLIFNVGSTINYSLRVMNTGDIAKIHGAIGLGYHVSNGSVYFTGRYANEHAQVSSGGTITWTGSIEVLHKDYVAAGMTPRGPAVYFMAGHEENNKIIWDRSEYIPVDLELESEYIDPTDPDGVPDDWEEPIYDDSRPWDALQPDLMSFIYIGFAGLIGYLLVRSQ